MLFFGVINAFFFAFALLGSSYYRFYGLPPIPQGITRVLPRLLEHFPDLDVYLTPSKDDKPSAFSMDYGDGDPFQRTPVLDVNWTPSNNDEPSVFSIDYGDFRRHLARHTQVSKKVLG